jgi:protein-S-isoprenylcysteine O-methyltransferase Ste14
MMRRNYRIPGGAMCVAALCGAVIGAIIGALLRTRPGVSTLPKLQALIERTTPWAALDSIVLAHWPFFAASVVGWGLFSGYWEAAAKSAAPARNSESRVSRALHVFLVNLALLFEFMPVRGLGRYLPASSLIMAVGLTVQAIGTFLAVWARRHLGRNWSGAIAIKIEHQLIRSGPYRLLRHPIYTGLLAMHIGPAIVTGEWHALIGVAMAAFAYWRKIRLEEAALRVAFGADYDAYRRATWDLLPRLF